ncbi:PAS domain S-box protein [Rubrobacter radiotolerans]|uniref:LuxR C-terminal-related transcriptional regulator n=1 Tax=Rubrobacter radiotolerans TaxID=42256 RepID=A0A023X6X6_RUBRA|nr:LuxR C-terminal-related transcriptional regulator [Rubrobacter radiotolerans]AHY47780.1 PAS domain S-box protein [Rubrobacter radiotolerans]MDX5892419.1 LuxR C-terminal-related transcriptional regulator [Rubrobacter radiotolerans]SMC07710.1 PAS domain S-box-containing protein [Rubrobacter radiotolerans DSM 5868]
MEAALKRTAPGGENRASAVAPSGNGYAPEARLPEAVRILTRVRTADALFVLDPEGRIVHWDAEAEAMTGFLSEETVGRRCHEMLRGEREGGGRLSAGECPISALARAGQAIPSYDMRIETRVRGKRWVNVSVLVVESERGPYLVHLMRDFQRTHDTIQMARDLIQLSSRERSLALPERARKRTPELTPRQAEVLGLLSSGRSAKEIGEKLYLSEATVRNHIRAILQALEAHSQLEALARARELGLLEG